MVSPPAAVPVPATKEIERGRFAPSPSGALHFGSLIAALGSFLSARSCSGEWTVRIEDLDTPRVLPGAADAILRTLEVYGMTWDGAVSYQSQRSEYYEAALDYLTDQHLTYHCSCSRRRIAQLTGANSSSLVYPGTCRQGRRQTHRPAAVRLRTDSRIINFDDHIQGPYSQHLQTAVGDFVIRRADGLFAYQLAVVVDDAEQGITHVVRGSDLLDSTPRQIYLQQALGLATPRYSHLPLAVNTHGNKLSKQTGALALDQQLPGPTLMTALRFLNQNPPLELERDSVAAILSWATAHWRPERVFKVTAIPWTASSKAEPAVKK